MAAAGRDRTVKWVIILGAIVAAVVVYGIFSDGFGLYGIETRPDMTQTRPTP